MIKPFQLIGPASNYEAGLENYLKNVNLDPINRDYSVISIIGCQSSGKSTFLNYLFETNFEVLIMQRTKMRCQTTKGET